MASIASVPPELRKGLRNFWHPVLLASDVPADKPIAVTRLCEDLVVWRDGEGAAHVFPDRCAHRCVKLSYGAVVGGRLHCRYHGLQYDGTGQCRLVPSEQCDDGPYAQRLRVPGYPTEERRGLIFAYLGDVEAFPPPPLEIDDFMEDPKQVGILRETFWEANWLLIRDNTADPPHLPFLHGAFAARIQDGELELDRIGPGNPFMTEEVVLESVRDPVKIVDTPNGGVLVTRENATADSHAVTFDEVEWSLPSIGKVWVPFPGRPLPMRNVQWELPVDETRTVVYSFSAVRCDDDGERAEFQQIMDEMVWPAVKQIFDEDSWMINSQGDIDDARANEHLLPFDIGIIKIRKLILAEFERQQQVLADRHGPGGNGQGSETRSAATAITTPVD